MCYNGAIMIDPTDIRLDDIIRMRKKHPCGGYEWQVLRLGSDIGIKCLTCERKVYLPRSRFARQVKQFVSRGLDEQEVVKG